MSTERKMNNCPNCGAPISGDKCPYCGTIIWDFATIDMEAPHWIKIKMKNEIRWVRVHFTGMHIEYQDTAKFYADNEYIIFPRSPDEAEFMAKFKVVPDEKGIYMMIVDKKNDH